MNRNGRIFFLDFMIQLTAGEYAIKLSILKLCLRHDLVTDTFWTRLVDNSLFPFLSI